MQNKMPIPESLDKIEKYMEERIGLGVSFDLGIRKLKILRKDVHMYYVNGLTDSLIIVQLIEELVEINDNEKQSSKIFEIVENRLVHDSVEQIKTMDELVDQVLSGLIVVVIEGENTAFVVDVRSYPGRTPQEPDTEKVIRGSRDGFVENIILNTALTRRRIKDERLRFEITSVGERSKTDVAIGYIKDIADADLIDIIRKEIANIKIDGIPMADKTVEEFLFKQGYDPFPYVRYTERADVAATHLLEGHVLVYVDTSPSVIITPTTYFYHMQHAEEYRQSPAVGTFERWMRFIGILSSLFLLPLWFLFALEPSLLPESLAFIGPNEKTNVPIIVQIFLADFGIEILRMAAIHTPTPLATAMGLIAAVLIGQIAIDVGLFVPEVILYVSLAAIGTYTTPSYELSVANKITRLCFLIAVAIFHGPGFVVSITLFIIWLASKKPLNTPYLWPFIPFYPKALLQIIVRRAVPGSKLRPSINRPRDRVRQP
ncbi:spore germination protein [Bacillus sp. FJAT-29937]|uniref:spore germination protein n=1 Tax=Bacillus sp. FJAT-29937 TaxID=1720553 RepID=UPI00082EAC2E|nr:spore germination protein [Bacillus sp. FJAT-29937]